MQVIHTLLASVQPVDSSQTSGDSTECCVESGLGEGVCSPSRGSEDRLCCVCVRQQWREGHPVRERHSLLVCRVEGWSGWKSVED